MASRWVLRTISMAPDGITLEYIEPKADVRRNGLALNHVIYIPSGQDYDDGIENVNEAALELLGDALEDMHILQPLDPEDEARRLLEKAVDRVERESDTDDQEVTL